MRQRPFFRSLHTDSLEPRLMLSANLDARRRRRARSRLVVLRPHIVTWRPRLRMDSILFNPCGNPDPADRHWDAGNRLPEIGVALTPCWT